MKKLTLLVVVVLVVLAVLGAGWKWGSPVKNSGSATADGWTWTESSSIAWTS
jgi:hypothetical protein